MTEAKKQLTQRAASSQVTNQAKLPESSVLAEVAMENNVIQGNNNTITIINHSGVSTNADAQKSDPEVFPLSNVYITAQIPPDVAILHIQADGRDRYRFMGGDAAITLPLTESYEKPNISLDTLVREGKKPQKIRQTIKRFSLQHLVLREWLKKIIQKSDHKKYLVIADHTNFEIPWELLQPTPEALPYEYLGALVTTVRWQNIDSDDKITLKFDTEVFDNVDTIAYVNHHELNGNKEIELLKQINNNSVFHDIKKFHEHLQTKNSDSSFIYIAAHGLLNEDHDDIAIGVLSNENQQLNLVDLDMNPLQARGIVFLNTCHSGQDKDHSRIPNCRVGFVELFFRKGAKGIIGTLGGVGDYYAASVAKELIQACLDSPNLSVAALLQDIRAKAAKRLELPDNAKDVEKIELPDNDDPLLSFIFTFMYVYYGNPMTTLRLTRRTMQ